MPPVMCFYCGGAHAWFQCVEKPRGWTPDLSPKRGVRFGVDAVERRPRKEVVPNIPDGPGADRTEAPVERPEPVPGVPKVRMARAGKGFDKVAYQRAYMKARRAKLKAGRVVTENPVAGS